jgi:hypothetical protein
MVLQALYVAALIVIVGFCILAVIRKDIWIGKSGAALLCAIAVSAVKISEYPPRPALVTLVGCMAALCLLAYWRWKTYMESQGHYTTLLGRPRPAPQTT